MMLIVREHDLGVVKRLLRRQREPFWQIGRISHGRRGVKYVWTMNAE